MYSSLHNHDFYSLLDGYGSPKEMLDRAKEIGLNAYAITNHGNAYAHIYYDLIKKDYPEIKVIYGWELYECEDITIKDKDNKYFHLICLIRNEQGRKDLNKVITKSNFEGFYFKPRCTIEDIKPYAENFVISSACLASKLARESDFEKCVEYINEYKEAFPYFFLEMQSHSHQDQCLYNQKILELSKRTNTPFIITTDSHAPKKEDLYYQDKLIQIGRKSTNNDKNAIENSEVYEGCYMQSEQEIHECMDVQIGYDNVCIGLENTNKVADLIDEVSMPFQKPQLPTFPLPKGYKDNNDFLWHLVNQGWKDRGYDKLGEAEQKIRKERLNYEMEIIHSMGFDGYFLFVWDFIKAAEKLGIEVGKGRGSAAGSLVCYCCHITDIDPIKYGLIFERFLNPERVSMPDIDIDFAPNGRQKIIDYVVEKYGEGQVAQIITFGTMKAKLAIRDVGRALDIPYAEVDKVAKLVPFDLKMTISKALDISTELHALYENDPQIKELLDTSMALEGLPRHASTHAAGVVITSEPIVNYVPLQLNSENFITTQFTKDTVENLGLLKMDFLGLRNLTVIENAVKIIKRTRGIDLNMDEIDYDCKEVYELISSGNTDGVFQLESAGMQSFMQELKPDTLEDVIAGIALYRPGPMEQIPRYIKSKKNPKTIKYKHPLLKNILDVTYGCMVYQEQVLEIVRTLAGYSLGKADSMRRVISKKKADQMVIERKNFIYGSDDGDIPGCIKNGIDEQTAISIFDEINDFANYAFNKSHAAAYAFVTYQTAYLKTFYPVEYMASLISSIDDLDKINHYIANCKEMGIDRLPPDVNKSEDTFTVENNSIRFGLSAVKNVGRAMILNLVNERKNNGEFKTFSDFIDRMAGQDMNKRALEGLISCGAFDSMGVKRSQLLAVYEKALDGTARAARDNVAGQMSLFDTIEEQSEMQFPNIDELDKKTMLKMEKQSTGLYFSGHPMEEYTDKIKKLTKYNISDVLTSVHKDEDGNYHAVEGGLKDGDMMIICAAIASRKNKTTRSNAQMAFLNVEDVYGSVECIVFPKVLNEFSPLLQEDNLVAIACRLSIREDEAPKILMQSVQLLDEALMAKKEPKRLYIQLETRNDENLKNVEKYLSPYQGDMEVRLFFKDTRKMSSVPRRLWFNGTENAIYDLKNIFGEDNVKIK